MSKKRGRSLSTNEPVKHAPSPELAPVARLISGAREDRGLSQYDVAARVGCRAQQVSVWERGLARPRGSLALKLAEVLGLSLDALLAQPDPEPSDSNLKTIRSHVRRFPKLAALAAKAAS